MEHLNPQAKELNTILSNDNASFDVFLSSKGKAIFFPKLGIMQQAADAKNKKYNATTGFALEDDGEPVCFSSIADSINLPKKSIFPYAGSYGIAPLRDKWREQIYEKNPSLAVEITTPLVTCGITHGISTAGYAFLDEGDTVLMPDLYWGNYNLILKNAYGANIETWNTFRDDALDLESFAKKLEASPNKVIIALNFPNNPTGYMPTKNECETFANHIRNEAKNGKQIIVLCDDAYFGLTYEPGCFNESIFTYFADMHENVLALKLDGATKEEYVWGLRVGFISASYKNMSELARTSLENKFAGIIRGSVSNCSHLSQSLLLKAFESPSYAQEKRMKYDLLKLRYETVRESLSKDKYKEFFTPLPFNAGYFMCIKLRDGIDSEAVRQVLLSTYDTGIISMPGLVRIAFSSIPTNDIPVVIENIYNACSDVT